MQAQSQPLPGQTIVVPQGPNLQPATIIVQNASYNRAEELTVQYPAKQSLCLGAVQVICGAVCIIMNITAISFTLYYDLSEIGYGIWSGAFFIISGCLGIAAGRSPRMGLVVGHMIMAIISACFCAILLSFSAISVDITKRCSTYRNTRHTCSVLHGLNSVMLAMSFLEAVIAIWAAALCCSGLCRCCYTSSRGAVLYPVGQHQAMTGTTGVTYTQPGVTVIQQPAGAVYPQQPIGTAYPQQPVGTAYPQQPVGTAYPQQPAGTYPQQPVGTYSQQPVGTAYPQQPVGTTVPAQSTGDALFTATAPPPYTDSSHDYPTKL